ncbi:MAG: nitroreductase family deazaflavin-dependent oxidoreductase [Halioglobus sp.]|nr:nitroreductase family deazaflavin-dependent oxidoreductase [Halioglobus sp.]
MSTTFTRVEQSVFRRLNAVVEPAVRFGLGSPSLTPASLIVLETVGFKSGLLRRTPLWSYRLGAYRIITTARGQRSFWVKNLQKQAAVSYYLGGRRRAAQAVIIDGGLSDTQPAALPPSLRRVVKLVRALAPQGWVIAVLVPDRR